MTIKVGICGANGRMGQAIIKQSQNFPQCLITGKLTRETDAIELARVCQNSDVIIDFSSAEVLRPLIGEALRYKTKLVIGTTGLTEEHFNLMQQASQGIAVFYSANMSIGANLIASLGVKAKKVLGSDYDIEIIESHHRQKKDAPSGTALMIGKELAAAENLDFEKAAVFDRHNKGQRKDNDIGFSCVRGGDIHGEHIILFAGSDEVITIKHQALNRDIFAKGALKAAGQIIDKSPGYYSINSLFSLDI